MKLAAVPPRRTSRVLPPSPPPPADRARSPRSARTRCGIAGLPAGVSATCRLPPRLPAALIPSNALSNAGGTSPVSLLNFYVQRYCGAGQQIAFSTAGRGAPSASSLKRAGTKFGPSFSPSRRDQNTPAKLPQVVRSGSPMAGPSGKAVGNQDMVTGRFSALNGPHSG